MTSAAPSGLPHISFAATNPCHVYDLALALHAEGALAHYYSGYPRWRLRPPPDFPLTTAVWRTLVTYACERLPDGLRPSPVKVFRWQDTGFDRAVARLLDERAGEEVHGLPGQCKHIFERARALGIRTVLNHASGPLREQIRLVAPEYARAGWPAPLSEESDPALFAQLEEEMALADVHCAASSTVREQLAATGVDPAKIRVVGYGASPILFPKRPAPPPGPFRVCFAGRQTLRKGIHYLLRALEEGRLGDAEAHFYGPSARETEGDFKRYRGAPRLVRHGAVDQKTLGKAFGAASVLVLPSAEEAFGLVVVQALQTGLPCIVSDRVGARDLIRQRENGSVVPFGDVSALAAELEWWSLHPRRVEAVYDWSGPARLMLALSRAEI